MNSTAKNAAGIGPTRRLAAAVALATLAMLSLGGVAACSGSKTTPTAAAPHASTVTAAASTSPAVAVQTPSASASHTASGQTQQAAPASVSVSGTPSCGNKDLKLNFGAVTSAHGDLTLVFTDIAPHPCTLQGYPGVAVVNGSTTVLNAVRTLNGYIGDQRQLSSAPLVVLKPGATATAVLEWAGGTGQSCYPTGHGSIEVTAPNTTEPVTVPFIYPYTVGHGGMICSGFEIHPVVAGTIS